MAINQRTKAASKASIIHLLVSCLVAAACAVVVLHFWYPSPFGQLSGGRKLFLILVGVDVVCGPLLTLVLFNPAKPRRELLMDMSLVILVQLGALGYGLQTAYHARPLFLVFEVDRFRVISLPDYQGTDVESKLGALPEALRPRRFGGPVAVGFHKPASLEARKDVLFESSFGGLDYAERPEYYVPYDNELKLAALGRSKPLTDFVKRFPETRDEAYAIAAKAALPMEKGRFLPVLHKEDWVGVLGLDGSIIGFLPGDGFLVN
jgi:hypothetical protein